MYIFDPQNLELIPYEPSLQEYFSRVKINRGIISANGNLVIGSVLDGISVFSPDGKLISQIDKDNGLLNNTVLGLAFLGRNNLWLALDNGLNYIRLEEDPSYQLLSINEIGAVYSARIYENELYLATNQGVFYNSWPRVEGKFKLIPGTQGQAWQLDVYKDQLILSHNNGTYLLKNHNARKISGISGGSDLIEIDPEGNILAQSTYSNIIFFSHENNNWNYYRQLNNFSDLLRYLEVDHKKQLWASHMHRGIFKIQLGDDLTSMQSMEYFGEESFGKEYGVHVFKVENQVVFTTGDLLYTYDYLKNKIVPFDLLNKGVGSMQTAHRIVNAGNHYYWFISNQNIALFKIFGDKTISIKE